MSVNGYFPKTSRDTLYLNFNELNISNFDLLTLNKGIDVDGVIDGNLQLSGLSDRFTLLSNLDVAKLGVNGHTIGNAFVDASWNAADTSIMIDTELVRLDSEDKVLSLVCKYYTSRDNNLDFDLNLNEIDISVVNAFTKGVLSRVSGKLNGDLDVVGSLKKPVIIGDAELNDATCNIDYLNTYYNVNKSGYEDNTPNRFIKFTENRIDLQDIILIDTLGNIAVANGVITHDYLRNFNFDVYATLDNFLGMNMLGDESSSFYGTAIATGDLKIDGPLDDIVMNINAYTMPGTVIDIGLTSSSSINDNFIVFVDDDDNDDSHSPCLVACEILI
jgi:autotransporter translocation and assembly factor TamB